MQCLYCDRHLGFFHKGKDPFCSEQHEELYRNAAQRRLEDPYTPSAGVLESSANHADGEKSRAEDLAQLLKATQVDSGASVETSAEVTSAANSAEAVAMATSSTAATNASALPETGSVSHALPVGPPAGPPSDHGGNQAEEARPLSDSNVPSTAEEETDRRSEPRVKAVKMVKVATLRDPNREMSCALVDTSDSGIHFTADADFRVGEILVAELPDQLVLTEVRYSHAKDDRYAIGAARVQSASKGDVAPTSNGMERAELLIKALCDRVRTGFADESGHGADAAASEHRAQALERVARILEIWQNKKTDPNPQGGSAEPLVESAKKLDQVEKLDEVEKLDQAAPGASGQETQGETRSSSGAGRAFAAVASGLVIVGVLMVCVVQFRKSVAVTAPPAAPKVETTVNAGVKSTPEVKQGPAIVTTGVQAPAKVEAKPAPQVQEHVAAAPKAEPAPQVQQQTAAPKAEPAPQAIAAAQGPHRAQIKALATTWVGVSADGRKVFGAMVAKGSSKEIEYSKFAFVHAGNAAGVEITVDGQPVPMGNQPRLRLVELTTTGFKFLRWSNDDPPQP